MKLKFCGFKTLDDVEKAKNLNKTLTDNFNIF